MKQALLSNLCSLSSLKRTWMTLIQNSWLDENYYLHQFLDQVILKPTWLFTLFISHKEIPASIISMMARCRHQDIKPCFNHSIQLFHYISEVVVLYISREIHSAESDMPITISIWWLHLTTKIKQKDLFYRLMTTTMRVDLLLSAWVASIACSI